MSQFLSVKDTCCQIIVYFCSPLQDIDFISSSFHRSLLAQVLIDHQKWPNWLNQFNLCIFIQGYFWPLSSWIRFPQKESVITNVTLAPTVIDSFRYLVVKSKDKKLAPALHCLLSLSPVDEPEQISLS